MFITYHLQGINEILFYDYNILLGFDGLGVTYLYFKHKTVA
jgi:uncharacterized membrane protein